MGFRRSSIQTYLDHVNRLPFVLSSRARSAASSRLDLPGDSDLLLLTPTGEHRLAVEVKSTHLTQSLADHAIHRRSSLERPWLLLAPLIGSEIARYLVEHQVNYLDQRGNCHIQLGENYLAHIEGRSGPRRRPIDKGVRAAGFQVLFALLANPELCRQPLRTIAKAADVSTQPVFDMLHRLVAQGLMVRAKKGYIWLEGRRADALDQWLVGYQNIVRPKLIVDTYRTPDRDPRALEERIAPILSTRELTWRWGGAAAAHKLTGHYRGSRTVLHIEDMPGELPGELRALRASNRILRAPGANHPHHWPEDGNLVILDAFGSESLAGATSDTAHPLLVYSEMMLGHDERMREAGGEVFDRYLEYLR